MTPRATRYSPKRSVGTFDETNSGAPSTRKISLVTLAALDDELAGLAIGGEAREQPHRRDVGEVALLIGRLELLDRRALPRCRRPRS